MDRQPSVRQVAEPIDTRRKESGPSDRDHRHDQQQQEQQQTAGPIIGPTMMTLMVLPVLSLTLEAGASIRPLGR